MTADQDLTEASNFSQRDILIEQVKLVNEMLGQTSFIMSFFSLIVALLLRDLGKPVWVWLAVQICLKMGTIIYTKFFYDPGLIGKYPERAALRLMIVEPINAVGWASLIWVTAWGASANQIVLITMVFAGVLGGGASTYGPLPRVHAAYMAAFILVELTNGMVMAFNHTASSLSIVLPFLTLMYCMGTLVNTRSIAKAYQRFILMGFSNARLASALETEVHHARAARSEAEAANMAKSTFLASASHDLRQPIHAMGLFLSLMERWNLDDEQRATLGHCLSALGASSEMLDALLDFSRAEAGVIVAWPQPFAIGPLLSTIEAETAMMADEKQIVYRTRESEAVVHSDPTLVKLILLNLVTNAIRYTEKGGVLVACRRRGEQLSCEVWDTGVGIARANWEPIFSDFIQLGNPERDRRKGLGLGLAISRRLATLIGSQIEVVSTPGRGSVFRFCLPLSTQQPIEAPTSLSHTIDAHSRAAASAGKVHILVVDDDETIRLGLHAVLKEAGFSVEAVETLEEALDCARRHAPDFLICDFRLRAGRNGNEVVASIRALLKARIPALLITGDTHPDRLIEAAREDMEVLYKPIRPDRLMDAIANLLLVSHSPEHS